MYKNEKLKVYEITTKFETENNELKAIIYTL